MINEFNGSGVLYTKKEFIRKKIVSFIIKDSDSGKAWSFEVNRMRLPPQSRDMLDGILVHSMLCENSTIQYSLYAGRLISITGLIGANGTADYRTVDFRDMKSKSPDKSPNWGYADISYYSEAFKESLKRHPEYLKKISEDRRMSMRIYYCESCNAIVSFYEFAVLFLSVLIREHYENKKEYLDAPAMIREVRKEKKVPEFLKEEEWVSPYLYYMALKSIYVMDTQKIEKFVYMEPSIPVPVYQLHETLTMNLLKLKYGNSMSDVMNIAERFLILS